MGVGIVLFFLVFFLTVQIYDQSKEIDRLELSDWKYRALRATLPSNNVNVIHLVRAQCLERKRQKHPPVPAVRHPLDLRSLGSSKNYEDSVRHRYQMEQEAAMRDSIG